MPEQDVIELAESIWDAGLIQSIAGLAGKNDTAEIVAGGRRLRALQYLANQHPDLAETRPELANPLVMFLDNIFVERLWLSLKYERVYLHAWDTGSEAKTGVGKWLDFDNQKRPHSALGGKPPAVVYWQRNETTNPDQQLQSAA